MSNLFLTLVIAFIIIILALACLAIGWLITGKNKIERGACGRVPGKKIDDSCDSICNLCSGPLTNNESKDETSGSNSPKVEQSGSSEENK